MTNAARGDYDCPLRQLRTLTGETVRIQAVPVDVEKEEVFLK